MPRSSSIGDRPARRERIAGAAAPHLWKVAAVALAFPLAAALIPGPAGAFDCAQARAPLEKALCADPAAKAADDAMGGAFAALKAKLGPAGAAPLLADQREWLKGRNTKCSVDKAAAACLRREDEDRVRRLSAEPEAGPGTGRPLLPLIVHTAGSRRQTAVDLFLYRFPGPTSPGEAALDAAADAVVAASKANLADPATDAQTSFSSQATITYASPRLLSVRIDGWQFSGGMHGESENHNSNIDMAAGRPLAVGDLLAEADRGKVRQLCLGQVDGQIRKSLVDDGQDPDKDADAKQSLADAKSYAASNIDDALKNFGNWSFGADKATVAFNADTVAPYVFGFLQCSLPYRDLRPLAKPGFPLP